LRRGGQEAIPDTIVVWRNAVGRFRGVEDAKTLPSEIAIQQQTNAACVAKMMGIRSPSACRLQPVPTWSPVSCP
jgi:hypothetical protein